ncbi:LysR family transcriptional regulator [Brevibacillus agri]|uniref:LysR family transcriptional regulator n=1 Tax=Brevibacillus TaxID=55080 RepID=UPI000412CCAA|nr:MULTISPECIES: LysR family transcriptional regulator [Brevibacillus]MBY0054371.1 LysR family transcriptional regulator [Brevibacillus agri]MED1644203.1 LysR family transcriptional regulator [Brevibacillus agri]MED1655471.1 LysR family transcriptional regulator [Brevibacillus agri]MED1687389.1 LysR family transcriptional regulator [Brevibacillus agri]MED1692044.1 LysR family transcriptional regulator [Brevibacillus agri]
MEWQQLEYFQTLARMQHVTRAAEAMSLSQPALSRSIARLEEELGVPLFERQGRTIMLNRYGQLFLKRVNRILKEFEDGKQELRDLVHPDRGEVALGFLHTLGTSLIPDLIGAFRAKSPSIGFTMIQNHSYSLLEHLDAGELDLCLLAEPTETKLPIQWTPLWSEELFAIVPIGHPLAGRESILLSEIAEESFIFLKKGYALRRTTDQLFEQLGVTPRVTFEGEEAATVAGLVAAGLGVSLLPDLRGIDQSKIAQIRIRTPKCQRVIGMALVKGGYLSPAAVRFKEFILDYFGK